MSLAQDLEKDISWYAVVKIDGEKKLYTKGDIFCSSLDINKCLRIVDIKKDILLLKDIGSKEEFLVEAGERIPLEDTEIIFEKTVEENILGIR